MGNAWMGTPWARSQGLLAFPVNVREGVSVRRCMFAAKKSWPAEPRKRAGLGRPSRLFRCSLPCTVEPTRPRSSSSPRSLARCAKILTRSETLLWAQLRGRKLGVRFRRQHPLGLFIVDFFAPCARLVPRRGLPRVVVEVDGSVHDSVEARERDAVRQAELEKVYAVRFVRVRAELVERNVLAAVAVIRAALA